MGNESSTPATAEPVVDAAAEDKTMTTTKEAEDTAKREDDIRRLKEAAAHAAALEQLEADAAATKLEKGAVTASTTSQRSTSTNSTPPSSERPTTGGVIEGRVFAQGMLVRVHDFNDDIDGKEAVVTGLGRGKRGGQLYIRCEGKQMRVPAQNCIVEQDNAPHLTDSPTGTDRAVPRITAGVSGGRAFKQGMRIKIVGIEDFEGKEAVVSGIGGGNRRNQLYIRIQNRTMRIWAENALPVGENAESLLSSRGPDGSPQLPSVKASEGYAAGRAFKQGMRVQIVDIECMEGMEGVVTGLGTGARSKQLYVRVNGKQQRIWAENAIIVSSSMYATGGIDQATGGVDQEMPLTQRSGEASDSLEMGGVTYVKGMLVRIVGIDKYEGQTASVCGVGAAKSSKAGQLYLRTQEEKTVRVWAENAEPVVTRTALPALPELIEREPSTEEPPEYETGLSDTPPSMPKPEEEPEVVQSV